MVTELGVSSVKHVDGISQHNDDSRLGAKDRKSTRLNSSHLVISYAVFCLKKKTVVIPIPMPAITVFQSTEIWPVSGRKSFTTRGNALCTTTPSITPAAAPTNPSASPCIR